MEQQAPLFEPTGNAARKQARCPRCGPKGVVVQGVCVVCGFGGRNGPPRKRGPGRGKGTRRGRRR